MFQLQRQRKNKMGRGNYIKWGGIIGAAIAVFNYIIIALTNQSHYQGDTFFTKILLLPLSLCGKLIEVIFPSAFEGEMGGLPILGIFPIFMILVGLLIGFIISLFKSKN